MPTKRTPISRPRLPTLTREAIALFAELEQVPMRRRDTRAFKERAHELARMLGLVSERWTINSVLDRSREPCRPPHYQASKDWQTCRAVREQLLAAVELERAQHAA
jgi:hypothetical protein